MNYSASESSFRNVAPGKMSKDASERKITTSLHSDLDETTQLAREQAKNLIERKFKEPASLEDIDEMQQEYRRKLQAMESQLSSVVRTRLDGVKRARDLINASASQINELHAQFGQMQHLSRDCRGLFGKYNRIKTLHYARRNLSITTHLVEFYHTIPQKAKSLMTLLRDHPEQLKYVSNEVLKLEHWTKSFLEALKEYGKKAMVQSNYQGRGSADARIYQVVAESVRPQLRVVTDLSEAVRGHIVTIIGGRIDSRGNWLGGGCLELAMTDSAMLVRTLEVAEMICARAAHVYNKVRQEAISNGVDPDDAVTGLETPDAMKEEVLAGLKKGLEHKVIYQFSQMQMSSVDAGDSQVMATLGAATNLLVDLETVNEIVVPCFPPHYQIFSVFRKVYESFLSDLLYPLVSSQERIDTYDVKDMLEAIKWLEYYVSKVEHNDKFAAAIVDLNSMYLKRIKSQIKEWVKNLKDQKLRPIQSSDGKWFTTLPDDMFNLINIQISVAKSLPEDFLAEVLLACLEALHDIQADTVMWIDTNWAQVASEENGTEILCSIVNDNLRLQEKSDDFIADLAQNLAAEERQKLSQKMDEVSGGYIEVALKGTIKIGASIISVLDSADITSKLFTPNWEDGSFEGMKSIIETHRDFFKDLELWLPDFFFVKLARSSLELICKMYVEKLCAAHRKPFSNLDIAVEAINEDMAALIEFFMEENMSVLGLTLGDILQQAGLKDRAAIQAQLQMVYDMLAIISSSNMDLLQVSTTQAAIKRIVTEFRSNGMDVLMNLIALQGKLGSDDKLAKKEFMERLSKTCGSFEGEVSAKYNLIGYPSKK